MKPLLATRSDLEERDGIIYLPFSEMPNTRMEAARDWRVLIAQPSSNPSRTDHIFRKFVYEHFYSQHSTAFFSTVGDGAKDKIVFDVGCGDCFGLEHWVGNCKAFHGIDVSSEQLALARKYLPKDRFPNVTLYRGIVDTEFFEPEFADFVISSEVIEHLDDPLGHVKKLSKWVKPGGYVSLSTPCPALYFYPSVLLPLIRSSGGRQFLRKALNSSAHWKEMLPSHPALQPHVLRDWFKGQGLSVIGQWSCLLLLETQWSVRLSRFLERKGWQAHLSLFRKFLKLKEAVPHTIPMLRMAGTRQFILARKTG